MSVPGTAAAAFEAAIGLPLGQNYHRYFKANAQSRHVLLTAIAGRICHAQ
jgi:hypothetical protein